MSKEKDWSIPDAGGMIDIPENLKELFNNIGMQLRLHTISDKNEVITVAHITQHAESFARSRAIEFAEWMYIYNTHYEYFKMYNGWKHKNTGHQDDVYIETSTFYSMFLAEQAKQKEGGII